MLKKIILYLNLCVLNFNIAHYQNVFFKQDIYYNRIINIHKQISNRQNINREYQITLTDKIKKLFIIITIILIFCFIIKKFYFEDHMTIIAVNNENLNMIAKEIINNDQEKLNQNDNLKFKEIKKISNVSDEKNFNIIEKDNNHEDKIIQIIYRRLSLKLSLMQQRKENREIIHLLRKNFKNYPQNIALRKIFTRSRFKHLYQIFSSLLKLICLDKKIINMILKRNLILKKKYFALWREKNKKRKVFNETMKVMNNLEKRYLIMNIKNFNKVFLVKKLNELKKRINSLGKLNELRKEKLNELRKKINSLGKKKFNEVEKK